MKNGSERAPQAAFARHVETARRAIRLLYNGRSRSAQRFRYALVVFDALTILYFITSVAWQPTSLLSAVDAVLGLMILSDLSARLWISDARLRECLKLYTIADLLVVASLLLAPVFTDDLAFLRILRGLRLIHSYHLVRDLRHDSRFFRLHEDAILAAVNLFVFVFVMASLVFVIAFDNGDGPDAYVDALYFTVSTLTTTGFGDITLDTPGGKLLTVFIMVVGVGLFLQLARAIFQPSRVRHTCPECGLTRHEPDAIHCKHCGEPLKIQTVGSPTA